MFDQNFRDNFLVNLQANMTAFSEESIQLMYSIKDTYFEILNLKLLADYHPLELNYEKGKRIIAEASKHNPIHLQLRDFYSFMSVNPVYSEIKFSIPFYNRGQEDANTPDRYTKYYDMTRQSYDFERECEQKFWQDNLNIAEYSQYSSFNTYIDFVFPEEQYYTVLNKYCIDVEKWFDYYLWTITSSFKDFTFSEKFSTVKKMRFLKSITPDLFLGFEIDKRDCLRTLKQGHFNFPDYLNLIIFDTKLKRGIKVEDYVYNYHEHIFCLGELRNPFFILKTSPHVYWNSFFGYIPYRPYESGFSYREFERKFYKTSKEGFLKVEHPQEHGERVRKYTFFYMKMLAFSVNSYLKYLEKSILASL